jgi:hypothetical protein
MIENLLKRLEELQEALKELQEVSRLNEELWIKDLSVQREKIRKLQKPRTEITPQNEIHKTSSEGSNVVLTEEPEADQVVYFIHDEQLSRCPKWK